MLSPRTKAGAPSFSRPLREGGDFRHLSATATLVDLMSQVAQGRSCLAHLFCKGRHGEAPARGSRLFLLSLYRLSSRPKLLIPEGDEKRSGGTRCFLHEQHRDQEQPVVVSILGCIRQSAAAMSAKSPALSQRTREGQGTRFCVS